MEERVLAKKSDLVAVANSIRGKTGSAEEMELAEMPGMIDGIGDGVSPVYQEIAEAMIHNKAGIVDAHVALFKDSASLSDYAFNKCSSITEINFPNLTIVPIYGFANCTKLTTVNLPNVTTLNAQAFYNCSKLVNLNLPSLQRINSSQALGSTAIKTITFPSVTYLGGYSFYYNKALVSVFLNANSTGSIGSRDFYDCTAFTTLVIRSEQAWTLGNIDSFTNTPIASGTGYIYVPSALVNTYKTAAKWSTYANQFRALEDYTVDGTITGALDETKIAAANV